ncbi:embigin [Oryctolagus cuniculus]|uniref:Embigin n=1 Tax=Oryctolagus cuniculus TaxID=9986 RepID=G1TC41_RABIT|nr:embigin [Oryctolagus cuniculus]
MRALTGLQCPRAPRLHFLLCLLLAARPSLADSQPTDSTFTSLPVREEMMAKYSNLSLESHNISLTEQSSMLMEKNITLERPCNVELTCQFTTSGDVNSVNVTWRKGNELLEDHLISTRGNMLSTQYMFTIVNSKQMGSYSCFFEDEKVHRGTFNIKVPELHRKNKPLVTYVGDSTVLSCKCQDCSPLNWSWYSSNGSTQVPVDIQMNDKYMMNGTHANETRLKIMHLSEEDGGSYWCRAQFHLGESEEHIELVVLSFWVPLKPFLAIIAEVVLLVAIILLCEVYTQKKRKQPDEGKEFEQIEQLKLDDSNGIENNAPRHRKSESVGQ